MKKIYLLLIAVAGVLTAASCAKELVDDSAQVNPGEVTTLTLSFDKTAKTALIDGKTTWLAGDVIRIYNASGKCYQDVTVPDEDKGKADIEVEVNMKDSKYFAIYPVDAANGIDSGKPSIKISANPDGRFASANISAAETPVNGTELRMRNVTAVLAIDVESNNTVEMVQVNAQNAMTGTYSVDLSGESPVLTAKSATKSATIATGAVDGTYYIAVAPGTYAEDFSVTALKGNGGYQTLTSTKSNEVAVNTILKLGKIGDNLTSGLPGEGTESNPYKISNLGEWTAFSASVNLGNTYANKIVALDTDIEEPVKTPVGYYLAADVQFPFKGTFLGNNHNVKLDLEGENAKSQNYVAFFGVLAEGATVKDLKLQGKVSATGSYTAALAGYCRGAEGELVNVTNCETNVTVNGGARVAGITGYATYTNLDNCTNKGAITGVNNTAGIVGYANATVTVQSCTNSGSIESTSDRYTAVFNPFSQGLVTGGESTADFGTGGIVGYMYSSSVKNCNNTGSVKALFKLGGICGYAYWAPVAESVNSGAVTGTGKYAYNIASQTGNGYGSMAGGITGWIRDNGSVSKCTNNGVVTACGGQGGIVGFITTGNNKSAVPYITDCINNADVIAAGVYKGGVAAQCAGIGGICGNSVMYGQYNATIVNCVNKGNVTSDNLTAGGILGRAYRSGNFTGGTSGTIKGCVNEGKVTATYWVGGIMGLSTGRRNSTFSIFNCENKGEVLANRTDDAGECAGGILGATYNTQSGYTTTTNIHNCKNVAGVYYQDKTHVKPYLGGIIGRLTAGSVRNCYSTGFAGVVNKETPAAGAENYLGALVGSHEVAGALDMSYYLVGVCDQAIGKTSKDAGSTVATFDDKYAFNGVVTVKEKDCDTLLDALNAWVGDSKDYYLWKAGASGPDFDIK